MSNITSIQNLDELKKAINEIPTDLLLIVVDANVYNLYRKKFDFLNFEGKKTLIWKCLEGENTKDFDEVKNALEFFLSKGVHRKAHLLAFGGGACSDYAGLVASLLLRGISWSVVPTTLLSMIDAAIGGKVAINSEYGKNLVGAFHMPDNVFVMKDFLDTLPDLYIRAGKGEMVKYCYLSTLIYNKVLDKNEFGSVIEACATYKQNIVDQDFKEGGIRKLLNLGHTIGHAIERIYKLEHGIAVLWGLIAIFYIYDENENLVELRKVLTALDFELGEPPWYNKSFSTEEIMSFIRNDKKSSSLEKLDIIRAKAIGDCYVENVAFSEIEQRLEEKSNDLRKFIL